MQPCQLENRTLLITRPQPEADSTARQVLACQGTPLLAPALTILPPQEAGPLHQALARQEEYRGILVTSVNGAKAIVSAMPADADPPPFFAVGAKTAAILTKQGWSVHLPAIRAGGEALAAAVVQWAATNPPARGKGDSNTFLFPQAEQGREELITEMQRAGYQVEKVVAYRAEPITRLAPETEQALAAGRVDAVLFFSGRSAQAFVAALPPDGKEWLAQTCIAVISPVTATVVEQLGYKVSVIATEPDSNGLLTALHRYWHPSAANTGLER
ncbi:MAG: uroporphyrinogen-III synthase [Magnetococcales bacterium]|nr:uroporphyrinogen-III synthase [Magnetococcales bacterium]